MSRLTPPTRLPTRAAPTPPQGSTPCGVRWRTCGSLRMLRRRLLTCSARCACMHACMHASKRAGQAARRPAGRAWEGQHMHTRPAGSRADARPTNPPAVHLPGPRRPAKCEGAGGEAHGDLLYAEAGWRTGRRGRPRQHALRAGLWAVGGRALGAAGIFVATSTVLCKIAAQRPINMPVAGARRHQQTQ